MSNIFFFIVAFCMIHENLNMKKKLTFLFLFAILLEDIKHSTKFYFIIFFYKIIKYLIKYLWMTLQLNAVVYEKKITRRTK